MSPCSRPITTSLRLRWCTSRVTPLGVICRRRAQAGRGAEKGDTMLGCRMYTPFRLRDDLVAQHLLSDQEKVPVVEIDRPAQPQVDAVAQLEWADHPPVGADDDAGVAGGQVGIVEQEIPIGAPDVDLVPDQ